MSAPAKQRKIDELMDKASAALAATNYFDAERLALKALLLARHEQNFERMARIVLPLQEARRQRMQQAIDVGTLSVIDSPISDDAKPRPGCYLVTPPNVGADARRLRMSAMQHDIPVLVLCREPLTQLKLLPVVALGPGSTIRVKVRPPRHVDSPDMEWFIATLEALGDWAIQSLDTSLPPVRMVDALLDRLDALPEHEELHQTLEAACRDAHREQQAQIEAGKVRAAKAKSRRAAVVGEPADDDAEGDSDIVGDDLAELDAESDADE